MENHFILKSRNGLQEPCKTTCCNHREELEEYFRDTKRYDKQHLSDKN